MHYVSWGGCMMHNHFAGVYMKLHLFNLFDLIQHYIVRYTACCPLIFFPLFVQFRPWVKWFQKYEQFCRKNYWRNLPVDLSLSLCPCVCLKWSIVYCINWLLIRRKMYPETSDAPAGPRQNKGARAKKENGEASSSETKVRCPCDGSLFTNSMVKVCCNWTYN